MVNVQQVDKHHDLFRAEHLRNMADLVALIMNLYVCKDGTLLYFFKNDQLLTQKSQ